MKKTDLFIGVLVLVVVGFACKQSNLTSPASKQSGAGQVQLPVIDRDEAFQDPNTKVSFIYKSYLQKETLLLP